MFSWIQKLFKRSKWSGGLDLDLKQNDERDFDLDALGGWFGYTPKHTRVVIPTLSTKNQDPQNTCVCESGAVQKEVDEGVVLSPQSVALYLTQRGEMTSTGTSLVKFQNALANFGISEWQYMPNKYEVSWSEFSHPKHLTANAKANAAQHKTKSFWRTNSLETVLQQLDLGRIGQTGGQWYTGYNPSQMSKPWIIEFQSGGLVGGHAYVIVGYDLEYYGQKVLICKNSYGNTYDQSLFYVKFSDFSRLFPFGVYFNLDIERDTAEWLNKNATKAILEANGPKVYVIEGTKKRYVPDEAIMWMLDITPSELVKDIDNMLKDIPEGEPMSMKDIPSHKQEEIKYFVSMSRDEAFMRERFQKYFSDLWS